MVGSSPDRRRVVLVNGLPGSGKTTLARSVSVELGLPLLSKDTVKETLGDVLAPAAPDPPTRRRYGAAAAEVLWSLLTDMPGGAVVESWMTPTRPYAVAGLRRAGTDRVLELWCEVSPGLARERFEARAVSRHPIHGPQVDLPDWPHWGEHAHPLALGPVLRVPTDSPVDLPSVVGWLRAEA